nr:MAG TPA: hypothetical protein [Bacteriophage sp.]
MGIIFLIIQKKVFFLLNVYFSEIFLTFLNCFLINYFQIIFYCILHKKDIIFFIFHILFKQNFQVLLYNLFQYQNILNVIIKNIQYFYY